MRVLLFAFLLIGFSGFTQLYEPENELLWEVSGNGLKEKSYLFGTFHNNHKDLFRFPDTLYYALHKAKTIALETDLFSLFKKVDVRESDVNLQFDMYGDPYTTTERATNTVYGNEDGMPQFVDAYFQQYAGNASKSLFFFESYEDQIKVFSGIKKSKQPYLQENLLGVGELREEVVFNLYLKGQINKIEEFTRKSLRYSKNGYIDLIVNRNGIMAEGLDSVMKKGSVFCGVGASHLGGTTGIISQLRKKGYTVRKIAATYSEMPQPEKRKVRETNFYRYQNEEADVVAMFPGKPVETKRTDGSIELLYCELGQGNTYMVEIIPLTDTLSLEYYANIHIAGSTILEPTKVQLDDGTIVMEGLSDTYPEGYNWVRVMKNETTLVVMKAYGGNKFMVSNRQKNFFAKVWLGQ